MLQALQRAAIVLTRPTRADDFDASNVDGFKDIDASEGQTSEELALAASSTAALPATSDDEVISLPGPTAGNDDELLDKDDTISEADVYIAYGYTRSGRRVINQGHRAQAR